MLFVSSRANPQFTAKSLNRQAKKANKDETAEKNKLKAALQKGNTEGARIYAQNAIRKKTEALNLLRLASRIDAVASRVETAVTMRTVTNSMGNVVKGMDKAMESMNLERVSGECASEARPSLRSVLAQCSVAAYAKWCRLLCRRHRYPAQGV